MLNQELYACYSIEPVYAKACIELPIPSTLRAACNRRAREPREAAAGRLTLSTALSPKIRMRLRLLLGSSFQDLNFFP